MLHQVSQRALKEASVLIFESALTRIVAHRTSLRFLYLPSHETSRVAISWHCRAYFIFPTHFV